MRISIASGKGGTGKTTVATNLALAIGADVQLLDCDVEEPNAHFFINPTFEETIPVFTPVPQVDEEKCTFCGEWFCSDTRFGPLVHARLGIAEENSGKLVTLVRQESKRLADEKNLDLVLTDGPPGVGCIENFTKDEGLSFLGRIPFDPIFTKAMVHGQTIFEYNSDSNAGQAVKEIWKKLSKKIALN